MATSWALGADPATSALGCRFAGVRSPEPLLKCRDLQKSQAFQKAASLHPNWEWQVMVDAIVNNKPLKPIADQLVATRQKALTSTLQQEAGTGLHVSTDCFTFSNWNYDQNYNASDYPQS